MANRNRELEAREYLEVVHRCAVFNLRKATRVLTQRYEREMRPCGILPTQFSLLVAVRLFGPAPVGVLADGLMMDRTTLSRNLKPLQKMGLLVLSPSPADQRLREVHLTGKGVEQLQQALPCWQRAQQAVERDFGAERLQGLLDDLAALVAACG